MSDVIVYGGTPGGVVAAYTAAKAGRSVVLLEPTGHLGGMVANGGLCATDIGDRTSVGGYAKEFFNRVDAYHPGGNHWVYEPHVAEAIFGAMLSDAGVTVVLNAPLVEGAGVTKSGLAITIVHTAVGDYAGSVFIDAGYEGDLMAQAGVTSVVGREAIATYGETLAGAQAPRGVVTVSGTVPTYITDYTAPGAPGTADARVQDANHRLCFSSDPATLIPFTAPAGYDASLYGLVADYLATKTNPKLSDILAIFALPNSLWDVNEVGGASMAVPGKDWTWATGSYATRAAIEAWQATYSAGLIWFLAQDASIAALPGETIQAGLAAYGWAPTEWADNGHFPRRLYVREGRRMVGSYVMRQSDISTTALKTDGVGFGSYRIDAHYVSRWAVGQRVYVEGGIGGKYLDYAIPYSSLTSQSVECTNLLVPVCASTSHVAWASYRMEPHFMIAGEAAGQAAADAIRDSLIIQNVDVTTLRSELTAHGAILPPLPATPPAPPPPAVAPIPVSPYQAIEAWVTDPAGNVLGYLDRTTRKRPYRAFAFSWLRGSAAGSCSLQYAEDSDIDRTLFVRGNLIWMSYRGECRVYVSRGRKRGLTRDEHGSDWATVTGAAVKAVLLRRRLVNPTAFDPSTVAGRTPKNWGKDAQARRFAGRAAGEMIWDLIDESNDRFPIPITRGTVETTSSDGWTQDFRFETVRDVVDAVELAFGDVDIVGDPLTGNLVYNYYNSIGSDLSNSVIFEERVDLADLNVDESAGTADEPATYIVGGGANPGVTQPTLGIADSGATDRVEAYADLSSAKTAAQVQTETTAALAAQSLINGTSIALEVKEDHYLAITDYGKGDTVRVIGADVDEVAQIVGLYILEDTDELVHANVDLGAPRTSEEIKARARQQAAARLNSLSTLGVPGQIVPFPIADSVYFDTTTDSITGFYIPDRVDLIIEARLAIDFDQYPMPVSAAAGTSAAATHNHGFATWESDTPGAFTKRQYAVYDSIYAGARHANFETATSMAVLATTTEIGNVGHSHSVNVSLTAGATKEAYPASHSATLKVYLLTGGVWVQQGATISGLVADAEDLDLTAYLANFVGPARGRIVLQSAAAQPNGGRIGAHLSGFVLAAIPST